MEINEILFEYMNDEHTSLNEYFFLVACEVGYIDWLQWARYIDNNLAYNMKDNMPFKIACENNNMEMAKYIAKCCPNMEFDNGDFFLRELKDHNYKLALLVYELLPQLYDCLSMDDKMDVFMSWCDVNYEMAQWFFEKFPNIPIHIENHFLFIDACVNNNIELASLLALVKPSCYYINIYDDNIIHWDIQFTLSIKNEKAKENIPLIENCYICYENASNILTKCNHFYCMNCLQQHYERNNVKCPYCRQENYENSLSLIV